MPKINKSIEIVISTNKRLSSMSLDSRVEIKAILEKHYADVRITDVCNIAELDKVIARRPDLVFLGMKFVSDDSSVDARPIWLSQRLSEAGIAYTGSDKAASMLEHNKQLAKQQVYGQGLVTAASLLLRHGEHYEEREITVDYPIFIKPVDGGGGSGINEHSLVHNFSELEQQVAWLMDCHQTDVLLESYLPGREFSVGILQEISSTQFHALPLEIVAPPNQTGSRFLSSRIKRADAEQAFEITDPQLHSTLCAFALSAFEALGGQDYGRIDVRMDSNGTPHFLEANLLPSLLNNYGNLPKASLMNIGLTHERLVLQITTLGLAKNAEALPLVDDSLGYVPGVRLQELLA